MKIQTQKGNASFAYTPKTNTSVFFYSLKKFWAFYRKTERKGEVFLKCVNLVIDLETLTSIGTMEHIDDDTYRVSNHPNCDIRPDFIPFTSLAVLQSLNRITMVDFSSL